MTFLFVYAIMASGLAMIGCWLEMDRDSGWRMVWMPIVLAFMAAFALLFLDPATVGLLGLPIAIALIAALIVSAGGLIGAMSRKRAEVMKTVSILGLSTFFLVFFGLALLNFSSMS